MKKIIIILVLIAVAVGGYRFLSSRQKGEKPTETVFNSLKEALTTTVPLKCEIKVEENKKVVVYIKGKKQRVEGVGYEGDEQGVMINDGQYVYIWNEDKKEGVKYSLAAVEIEAEKTLSEEQKSPEEWIKEYEEYKPDCKATLVSDEIFVPPSDVVFQDLDELFKSLEKIEEDLPTSGMAPEEAEMPSQEEIEKLIKEFEGKE